MKGISYLIIGLALVGLAVAGTLSQQGGIMTWNGTPVVIEGGAEYTLINATLQEPVVNLSDAGNVYFKHNFFPTTANQYADGGCLNRPLIGEDADVEYIVSNDAELKEALCKVPVIAKRNIVIKLKPNIYNDTYFVVAPITAGSISETEGQEGVLYIRGENFSTTAREHYQVNSFQILGGLANQNVVMQILTIFGEDKYSDEQAQISIYGGGGSVVLSYLKFVNTNNDNPQTAIQAYGTNMAYITKNVFNSSTDYAVRVKRFGTVFFGDAYGDAYNTGSVNKALFLGEGYFTSGTDRNRVEAPIIADCDGTIDKYRQGGTVIYDNVEVCTFKQYNELDLNKLYYYAPLNEQINFTYDEINDNIATAINGASHNGLYTTLDGTNDYIDTGIDVELESFNSHSLNFWAQLARPSASSAYIISANQDRFSCILANYDLLYCKTTNSAGTTRPTDPLNISEYYGKWTHFSFVVDIEEEVMKIYINGEIAETKTITDKTFYNLSVTTSNLLIGARAQGTKDLFTKGNISQVMIWNRTVTQEEARQLYLNAQGMGYNNKIDKTIEFPYIYKKDIFTAKNRFNLYGTGNAFACINSNGIIYRSNTTCS